MEDKAYDELRKNLKAAGSTIALRDDGSCNVRNLAACSPLVTAPCVLHLSQPHVLRIGHSPAFHPICHSPTVSPICRHVIHCSSR